jgi:hypothetical protein
MPTNDEARLLEMYIFYAQHLMKISFLTGARGCAEKGVKTVRISDAFPALTCVDS